MPRPLGAQSSRAVRPMPASRSGGARHTSARGFAFIEVLVSLLVLSLGLLSLGALMMAGLNNAVASDLSSRATQYATQIMDAMRANPGNASAYVCSEGQCDPGADSTTVAQLDRSAWMSAVKSLPGGTASIAQVSGGTQYVVTIKFDDCLGTVSTAQKTECKAVASASTPQRSVVFQFEI